MCSKMSSNYPEGSMRGSGIYSVDVTLRVECEHCAYDWDEDFATDDWGNVGADVVCPECKETFWFEAEQDEPEPDYDSMYKERYLD